MSEETVSDEYIKQAIQQFGNVIDPSLAKYFVDFEDVIDSLRMVLTGQDVDYQHSPPTLVEFGEPMMNRLGIGKVLAKLKMIHKGIPMSNFEKMTPYVFTRLQSYTMARELFIHMESYGIKNSDDMQKIIELVMISLFAVYNRPVGEGERKFIKGYMKESHVIAQPKKSRFSLT